MKQVIVLLLLAPGLQRLYSQQLNYSLAETIAIHDSISNSRWDIGGSLSHYSFRFMSEFFPTAIINKPSIPFELKETPIKKIEDINIKKGNDSLTLTNYLQSLHMNGFIVVHNAKIVYEKYFSMQPQELHTLQSVTKVITATLVTQLINEKEIRRELPIETYLPEMKNTDWEGVTVAQIMDMRSGMKGSELSEEMGGFTNPHHPYYAFEEALGVLPKVDSIVPSVYQYVSTMKKKWPTSQDAEYHSMCTFILGWLAEKVTGKKYADLVSERIWKPMGASSHAYTCISNKGVAWMHGGISSTLRDLARFGSLYTFPGIKKRKEKFISFNQLTEIFNTPVTDKGFEKFNWGYQWDIARDGYIMKGGFGGQALIVFPEKDIVIAYFNHIDKGWGVVMPSETAIKAIVQAIEMK